MAEEAVVLDEGEPVIVHAPATTAWYGQPIPIEAASVCGSGSSCGVRLFYRSTTSGHDLLGLDSGAWSSVELTDAGTTSLGGDDARNWTGQIPGTYVTTTGVDYFLEAYEDASMNRLPPSVTVEPDQPIDGYFHVTIVSPPLIQHTPPLYAYSDRSLLIEATATCSTPQCSATLWYRQSDGGDLGELTAPPAWPNQTMRPVGTAPVAPAGTALIFQADIPASVVTTAGVDYFIEVSDGHTTSWWPGTTYRGYYAPRDGMRTGYHHVHVLEAPSIVSQPVITAPYRQDIPVSAQAGCPSTRNCTATLHFRTTQQPPAQFSTAPMAVTKLASAAEVDLIDVQGTIPADVVDTRGVDYLVEVSDGTSSSWWPGTRPVDGYYEVEGTPALWHQIRVLEPPHMTTRPAPATPALRPHTVNAEVTCVTESCQVKLHYFDTLTPDVTLEPQPQPNTILMQPQGDPVHTPLGDQYRYQATIPAEQVTTRGLAYYIEAFDGYTHEFAPGTGYWGAYVPTDGQSIGAVGKVATFPVRVLEPPHIMHLPPLVAPRNQPLDVVATSNCSSPACSAAVQWLHQDGTWLELAMTAGPASGLPTLPPEFGALWEYRATIPAEVTDVDALTYRFVVDDGYVQSFSQAYVLATQSLL